MNSEGLVNSEIDKAAEDEKKSINLEEEQECSQAVVESKNGDDTDNDVDTTKVENKCKAGEESEQKDDKSASAEDDKKSETGKESSEVDNTCNEKASESINNDNTEDVMDIAEQIVENKAVQDLEQEKETVSVEDNEKSKYFTDVKERSPVDNDKEVPENTKDTENVKHTEEKKVKDILQAVQESKQKEDSPDKDVPDVPESSQETVINSSPQENTEAVQESKQKEDSPGKDVPDVPESSQETVIDNSPQENTEAGPDYSNKDFETEESGGSDTDKNSESEDNSSEMGACIPKPKSHSKKGNSKSHRENGFSDDDDCDLSKEDHEKAGNGKVIQYLSIVWTVLSYVLHFVVGGCRKFVRTLFKIPVGLLMLYYTFQGPLNKKPRNDREDQQQGRQSKEEDRKLKLKKKPSERDTCNYRDGYPGKVDDPRKKKNLKFYTGRIPCEPDGDYIDNIHNEWWGNYNLLERHHGYIQWIFPIREEGMNWQAQPLQKHEAEAIKADPEAHARVLMSYKMMLDFYGMKLVNSKTGKLTRTNNYEERFDNLNWSGHNYLRITRILKSLGEFGYEHLKKGFIQFVLDEALIHKTLKRTLSSCRDYWIGTIKSEEDRDELYQYIEDNTA